MKIKRNFFISTAKKVCCGVLATAMVITGLPQGMYGENEKTVYAESTEKKYTVGNSTYTYTVDGDTVTITGYEGKDTKIVIPDEIEGKKIVGIGSYVFFNRRSLIKIEIPSSVTSIGSSAFSGCRGLIEIEIPSSVTSIGNGAFIDCGSLEKIMVDKKNEKYDSRENSNAIIETDSNTLIAGCKNTIIPDSVASIGYDAFRDCSRLTEIEIPSSVTSIGDWVFYGCSRLTEIEIPNSVKSIGNDVFSGCSSLTKIEIPSSVTSIGNDVFSGCRDMTEIEIPSSVTSIGWSAFEGCSSLTKIEIPSSVTRIGSSAFEGCSSLTKIEIPSSVTSIDGNAFSGCSSLEKITVDKKNEKYDSRENSNAIIETDSNTLIAGCKNTIIPDSVTSIGSNAFSGCSGITKIAIPEGVTSIGYYAFESCSRLTEIEIPSSITSIGGSAFSGCSGITKIAIPEGVTSIGYYAFESCNSLTEIEIPSSITSIGGGTFEGCSSLTKIAIPEGVTSIGYYSFEGCSSLTEIEIPSSVASIGNGAFIDCSSLEKIMVDKKNEKYDSRENSNAIIETDSNILIAGCKNTIIPDSVTSIGISAFSGCSSLTEIKIPEGVTSIEVSAFSGCSSLEKITVDKKNETYDSRENSNAIIETDSNILMAGCKNTTIPNSVTSIGTAAFRGCSSLTEMAIPSSVTSIEGGAFKDCSSLIEIEIPSSVASIEWDAFSGCSSLEKITVDKKNETYDSRENSNTIIETDSNTLMVGCKNTTIPNSVTSIGQAFIGCTSITEIEIPSSVTSIGSVAFLGCISLTEIEIPSSVMSIDEYAFADCINLTIYGNQNSYAQTYAENNNIPFCAIEELTSDDNITVTYNTDDEPQNLKLYIKKLTNLDEEYKNIDFTGKLVDETVSPLDVKFTGYDMFLLDGSGKTVQPNNTVTVKIPCPNEYDGTKCKVYRAEKDGTFTDMSAVYKNEYLVFETNHFSTYIITETELVANRDMILGDVNGDGEVDIKDSALIKRHLAGWEVDINMSAADVNEDGDVNIKDSALIKRVLVGWE